LRDSINKTPLEKILPKDREIMVNMKVMLGISHTLFFKKKFFFAAETRPLAWGPPSESCWMLLWPLLELFYFLRKRGE